MGCNVKVKKSLHYLSNMINTTQYYTATELAQIVQDIKSTIECEGNTAQSTRDLIYYQAKLESKDFFKRSGGSPEGHSLLGKYHIATIK